jgi:hypothetical protein
MISNVQPGSIDTVLDKLEAWSSELAGNAKLTGMDLV